MSIDSDSMFYDIFGWDKLSDTNAFFVFFKNSLDNFDNFWCVK